jgi:DNA-binding HxlR family transcriptional regulator
MLGRYYEGEDCSAARALELVGERWSLLILRDAMFRGSTRFSEFERSLGLAPNILAERLAGFVESGIMTSDAAGHYHLSRRGLDLKEVVIALTRWGDRWVRPGPVVFVHEGCGGSIEQNLRCTTCSAKAPVAEVGVKRSRHPKPVASGGGGGRKRG